MCQSTKSITESETKTEDDDPYAEMKKMDRIIFNFGYAVFQDLGRLN